MQSNYDALNEKWSPIIEHADLPDIGDSHKKAVTAVCLENTEKALKDLVLEHKVIKKATLNSDIKRFIYVPKRIVNVVI